jgi:hypothetical protein
MGGFEPDDPNDWREDPWEAVVIIIILLVLILHYAGVPMS